MTAPAVLLDNVSRTFAGAVPVHALRTCSLQIDSGDFVTIEGPSGSGKSTLLNILGLLDRPSTGTYLLDGIDVSKLSENLRSSLRGQRLGFVFQTFELLRHRPAIESVMLAMMYRGVDLESQRRAASSALDRVGLNHRQRSLASQLSGGERQRVAIARAIVNQPSLLLCDEPTGNLDSENAQAVLDLMVELNRSGVTIALITHNPEVAQYGNRRVTIRDGLLSEESKALGSQ